MSGQQQFTGPTLVWGGKGSAARAQASPLCLLERITPPGSLAEPLPAWTNLLVRGDNRTVLASLSEGFWRERIERAGGLKLVYMDPPFAVGADFTMPAGPAAPGTPSLQAVAYSDVWEGGLNGFLSMLHERLVLVRNLLAPDGSLFLHCDRRTAAYSRLLLDEVFGPERFLGDIVWHYTGGGRATRWFSRKHDRILHYAVSDRWTFNPDAVRVPYKPTSNYAKSGIVSRAGRRYMPHPDGTPVDDVWDIPIINPMSGERNGYPTQKPERLLERIIAAASNPGDLVADFFCGSGTTPAVAGRMGRQWIAVDASSQAVHTARKRLAAPVLAPEGATAPQPPFVTATLALEGKGPGGVSLVPGEPALCPDIFRHSAALAGGRLDYGISDIRLAAHHDDQGAVLELCGFRAWPESGNHAAASDLFAAEEGAVPPLLAGWSVGLRAKADDCFAGSGAFCHSLYSTLLWRMAAERGGPVPLRTPCLPAVFSGDTLELVVALEDVFGNVCRFPVPLYLKGIRA